MAEPTALFQLAEFHEALFQLAEFQEALFQLALFQLAWLQPGVAATVVAVWSGTSFAAPVLAGRLAAALEPSLPAAGEPAGAARDRAWQVLEALTPLRHG